MSAIGIIGSVLSGAAELALKLLQLKRVKVPPKLEGPVHTYPKELTASTTYYQLHCCTKCSLFNEDMAAYTVPPCREKQPKVIVELP